MWIRCCSCLLIPWGTVHPLKGQWRMVNGLTLSSTVPHSLKHECAIKIGYKPKIYYKLPQRKLTPSQLNACSTYDKTAARKGFMRFHYFSSYLCIVLSNVLASTSSNYCRGIIMQRCRFSVLPCIEEYAPLSIPMPGLNLSTAALHNYLLKAEVDHHKGEWKSTPFTSEGN